MIAFEIVNHLDDGTHLKGPFVPGMGNALVGRVKLKTPGSGQGEIVHVKSILWMIRVLAPHRETGGNSTGAAFATRGTGSSVEPV